MARTLEPIQGAPGKFRNTVTGTIVDISEYREDDKYDTVNLIPTGAVAPYTMLAGSLYQFFVNVPMGKQLIDTNFTTPSKLPAGEEMFVDRIWAYVPSCIGNVLPTPSDIKRIVDNAYIHFRINKLDLKEGPLAFFPSGYGFAGNTVEGGQGVVSNGVPSVAAQTKLRNEQYLGRDSDITADLTFFNRNWDAPLVALAATMPILSTQCHVKAGFHGLVKAATTKG